jgi:hypothetical protein
VKTTALALAALLTPLAASAQLLPGPPNGRPSVGQLRMPSVPATTVSEITVLPRAVCLPPSRDDSVPPPKIVDSFPANGAVLRPGLVVVRVTFDRPMSCEGFFFSDPLHSVACPHHRQDMLLSLDRRTIRTVCRLDAGRIYTLILNDAPANGPERDARNVFESLTGSAASPYEVKFNTSSGEPVRTVREALLEDPRPGVEGLGPAKNAPAAGAARFSPWTRPPQ